MKGINNNILATACYLNKLDTIPHITLGMPTSPISFNGEYNLGSL